MSKITEAIEVLKNAKEVKDLADILIPEVSIYMDRFADGLVDIKVRQINRYEINGFTREEAILLTIDSNLALQNALTTIKNTGSKK